MKYCNQINKDKFVGKEIIATAGDIVIVNPGCTHEAVATEDIASAGISEKFGYDQSYFCRLFKSAVGVRPTEYIRVLRLEKARRMLQNKEISISKIALECGFSDVNYFTRCFRKHYEITAGDYRKKDSQTKSSQ